MFSKIFHASRYLALQILPHTYDEGTFTQVACRFSVGNVSGQYELRFNEASQQTEHHHATNRIEERAHLTTQ